MTYISRGTRIIVSRWLDESDAEYKLRACRKRSDGRLKRHSSCDDLRAWINNNCINHEYLTELMSDGESTVKNHVRLYGRFIPVPILLKILQNIGKENEIPDTEKLNGISGTRRREQFPGGLKGFGSNENGGKNDSFSKSLDEENKKKLLKTLSEKYLLEKRFFECKTLLCKAVGKLEKIDSIVCTAYEECENERNREIEAAFQNSKSLCSCSVSSGSINSSSRINMKKVRDVNRCTEILRKISELRQKLKIIRDRRQEVNEQIRMSRNGRWSSNCQVTELYSRREEAKLKQLQKKLERLIAGKGKLLSELMDAICSLNKLKKSISRSKSQLSIRSRASSGVRCFPVACACGCQCTDNVESSNSPVSEDISQDEYYNNSRKNSFPHSQNGVHKNFSKNNEEYKSMRSVPGQKNNFGVWQAGLTQDSKRRKQSYSSASSSLPNVNQPTVKKNYETFESENTEKSSKSEKKSKLKFVSVEFPCKKKSLPHFFETNLDVYHLKGQRDAVKSGNVTNSRPSTSPVSGARGNKRKEIPERRIKSETTMEEIEKALRNYEQRLKSLDCLEYKIVKLRQKLLDESQRRQECLKDKCEEKKMREIEQEKSNREITKLCSENWALKRQVRQLMEKAETQMKKIDCLKANKKKVKELETEKDELQKELCNYQYNCEDQQKRIFMLERCTVEQRTEIEKLTNLIKKLKANTAKKSFQERNIQRSRSYSADSMKGKNRIYSNVQDGKYSVSSSEDDKWYSEDWPQQEIRCRPRFPSPVCYSPQPARRRGWCAN